MAYDTAMPVQNDYTARTSSSEATKALAAALAPCLQAGDVVMLAGDLGAGKTQFVQGVAQALGIGEEVTSPTFTILMQYETGRLPLYHFDLYRLEQAEELDDIGYFEALEGAGVSFVEWGHKFPGHMPCDYLEITFKVLPSEQRVLSVRALGERARKLRCCWAKNEHCLLNSIEESRA